MTQKISKQELRIIGTAPPPLDEIYPLEICSGQRTGRRPSAMGDPIMRPVFDGRKKSFIIMDALSKYQNCGFSFDYRVRPP